MRYVLPPAPEGVTNRDGTEKQGFQLNAAKKLLVKLRKTHPKPSFVAVGDGLYSDQPFITACKDQGVFFILAVKPADRKVLFEYVGEITATGQAGILETVSIKGRRHLYRWVQQVPINGSQKVGDANFFHYPLILKALHISHSFVPQRGALVHLCAGSSAAATFPTAACWM